MSEGLIFSYSIKTVNDDTTEWASRMDHYYAIGKYDVHMKQIMISLGIMLATTFLAAGYVKVSVTRDFALLLGGVSITSRRRNNQLQNHLNSQTDMEGRGLTGGLEVVSDATELVGW